MEFTTERKRLRERVFTRVNVILLVAGMAVAGCSGGDSDKADAHPNKSHRTTTSVPSSSKPSLVFDSLGGGPSTVMVYPGVTEVSADTHENGTFPDGSKVPAECATDGRDVHSVTSLGEEPRSSDQWILIDGTPGETQYASAVYIEHPDTLLNQLPRC
jgi:hypothetical protein